MSFDAWYKEPRERYLYQDREEGGETIRYTGGDLRKSSTTRRRPSPRRRESSRHRRRRGSPIRSQRDDRARFERAGDAYTYDSRSYGIPDEPPPANEHEQAYTSYRGGVASYAPQQGSYAPQQYAGETTTYLVQDARVATTYPVNDLAGQMQTLSTGDYCAQQATASSVPTAVGSYDSPPYGATQVVLASADYAQPVVTPATSNYQSTAPVSRHIKGTPGDSEKLDKSYQVRNHDYRKFFRVGRVFSTLWTDISGVEDSYQSDKSFVSEVVFKHGVYCKVRRFVVVQEGDRSVSCLPVTSYDSAGYTKKGVHLHENGFIYSSKNAPQKVEGMRSRPLKVILSRGAAHIKDPSLVNYGKVYTIETNVKVKDIGDLDSDSKALLLRYYKVAGESILSNANFEETRSQQGQAVIADTDGTGYCLSVQSPYSEPSEYNATSPVPSGYTAAPFTPAPPPTAPSQYASYSYTGPPQYDSNPYPAHSQYTSSSYTTTQAYPPVERPMSPHQSLTSLGYGEAPVSIPISNSISNYTRSADEYSKKAHRPSYSPPRSQPRRRRSSTDRSNKTKSDEWSRMPRKTSDTPKVEPENTSGVEPEVESKVQPENSEKVNQDGTWPGTAAKAIAPILAGVGWEVAKNMAAKVVGSNVELDGKERSRELPTEGTAPVIHHLNEGNPFELVGSLIQIDGMKSTE